MEDVSKKTQLVESKAPLLPPRTLRKRRYAFISTNFLAHPKKSRTPAPCSSESAVSGAPGTMDLRGCLRDCRKGITEGPLSEPQTSQKRRCRRPEFRSVKRQPAALTEVHSLIEFRTRPTARPERTHSELRARPELNRGVDFRSCCAHRARS